MHCSSPRESAGLDMLDASRGPPAPPAPPRRALRAPCAPRAGEPQPFPPPFVVLATQNPIEHEGTYPLPEAQVDRFILRIDVGYPTREQEIEILRRRRERRGEGERTPGGPHPPPG